MEEEGSPWTVPRRPEAMAAAGPMASADESAPARVEPVEARLVNLEREMQSRGELTARMEPVEARGTRLAARHTRRARTHGVGDSTAAAAVANARCALALARAHRLPTL